ncbi:LuxR family transcriptional regulator [Gymnodinialimonas sp. 2305UL16-5]
MDLWHIMLDYLHGEGVKMASYHLVTPDAEQVAVATDGYPEEWTCKYIEEKLVLVDPIPELASKLARPFYWHEIRDLVPTSSPAANRYLRAREDAKFGDGLAFYVFGPALRNAYVGLGFGVDRIELPPAKVFELQCVAQAGHLRVCDLTPLPDEAPVLTKREAEILGWAARGKSNAVISGILQISAHTVDTHMRNIYSKLDVTDRTSAVLRGVGQGIIQYPKTTTGITG